MAELTLKGKEAYIKHMYKHLRKEHPSTRSRMEMELKEQVRHRAKKITKREINKINDIIGKHYLKNIGREMID